MYGYFLYKYQENRFFLLRPSRWNNDYAISINIISGMKFSLIIFTKLKISTMNKHILFTFCMISLIVIFNSSCNSHGNSLKKEYEAKSEAVAVLELFTSEGCSSCPPADRLLMETAQDYQSSLPLFVLGFHVDYWNYIGWDDPYSKTDFSERQRNYAKFLNSSVYTPQLIVNGEDELVGSNRPKLEAALTKALNKAAISKIEIIESNIKTDGKLNIAYQLSNVPQKSYLNVAIVENDLKSDVKKGENKGKQLNHTNVVREFSTYKVPEGDFTGEANLTIPDYINKKNTQIFLYIQNVEDMAVTGATKVQF